MAYDNGFDQALDGGSPVEPAIGRDLVGEVIGEFGIAAGASRSLRS